MMLDPEGTAWGCSGWLATGKRGPATFWTGVLSKHCLRLGLRGKQGNMWSVSGVASLCTSLPHIAYRWGAKIFKLLLCRILSIPTISSIPAVVYSKIFGKSPPRRTRSSSVATFNGKILGNIPCMRMQIVACNRRCPINNLHFYLSHLNIGRSAWPIQVVLLFQHVVGCKGILSKRLRHRLAIHRG